jgi:hypothetical protein
LYVSRIIFLVLVCQGGSVVAAEIIPMRSCKIADKCYFQKNFF